VALARSTPSAGRNGWTGQWLADTIVERGIAESNSPEMVGSTLRKFALHLAKKLDPGLLTSVLMLNRLSSFRGEPETLKGVRPVWRGGGNSTSHGNSPAAYPTFSRTRTTRGEGRAALRYSGAHRKVDAGKLDG
jgi:hypothetical protein